MKRALRSVFVASVLMAPVLAYAASTAQLKLVGTITPEACTPNFAGGNTIDYGMIAASTLNVTAQTNLPEKMTSLTITCGAPVKFGITSTDERSGTVVSSLSTLDVADKASYNYGLGIAENGAKIGAYSIAIKNPTADTGKSGLVWSRDGGSVWVFGVDAFKAGTLLGFSNGVTGERIPTAHKSISIDLSVNAAIVKSENLPISDEIKIDGLSTIELKYL